MISLFSVKDKGLKAGIFKSQIGTWGVRWVNSETLLNYSDHGIRYFSQCQIMGNNEEWCGTIPILR